MPHIVCRERDSGVKMTINRIQHPGFRIQNGHLIPNPKSHILFLDADFCLLSFLPAVPLSTHNVWHLLHFPLKNISIWPKLYGTIFVQKTRKAGTQETNGKDKTMKVRYTFARLSRSEREFLEAVLLEEMEYQTWYAVSYSKSLRGEVLFMLQ